MGSKERYRVLLGDSLESQYGKYFGKVGIVRSQGQGGGGIKKIFGP